MLAVGRLTHTTESVTANHTLEPTSLAGADDGDKFSLLENVLELHLVTGVVILLKAAEFHELLTGIHTRLLEMACHGLVGSVLLAVTESHLHGSVAILVLSLDLGHHAGAHLEHGTGQVLTCLVVHAGHSDLLSNQSRHVRQTLISTSTPLGNSRRMSASTVAEELL